MREPGDRLVACQGVVVVEVRVDHLRPLVRTHDNEVTALGDVGDQLRVGHGEAHRAITDEASCVARSLLGRPLAGALLAERQP